VTIGHRVCDTCHRELAADRQSRPGFNAGVDVITAIQQSAIDFAVTRDVQPADRSFNGFGRFGHSRCRGRQRRFAIGTGQLGQPVNGPIADGPFGRADDRYFLSIGCNVHGHITQIGG
jgi:hypothetical protein